MVFYKKSHFNGLHDRAAAATRINAQKQASSKGRNAALSNRPLAQKGPTAQTAVKLCEGASKLDSSSSSTKFDFFNAHFCVGVPDNELFAFSEGEHSRRHAPIVERAELRDDEVGKQYMCHLSSILPKMDLDCKISPDDCIPFKRLLHHFHRLRAGRAATVNIERALYQYIGRYMDLCGVSRDDTDFQPLYCLHALAHVMRTRNLVINNKQKLEKAREQGTLTDELVEQCRDQGLARPKVLILAPMRKIAYTIVKTMVALMFGEEEERPFVQRLARFESEFGDADGNEIHEKRTVAQDYRDLMTGNVDDCFRLGIGLAKKCLKLYTPFNESDIVVCSPLGLKMLLDETAEASEKSQKRHKKSARLLLGEKRRKTNTENNHNNEEEDDGGPNDFLASIEVFIVERADIMMMQNWEHLQSVLSLLNGVPRRVRTDITRVRRWAAQGTHARHYRQTLLFTRTNAVEAHALFAQHCANFSGLATVVQRPLDPPLVKQICRPYIQEFYRFDAVSPEEQAEQRFQYFIQQIFPKCQTGTLLFVPSYFDFVRVRNWLKRQSEHFVQLHEYAPAGKVAKARNVFARGDRRLMLMTERFHYFFRYNVKGVNAIMFYQPPQNAHFYPELMQMASPKNGARLPCWMLFSKFDCLRLQDIFGPAATKILLDEQRENPQILEAN